MKTGEMRDSFTADDTKFREGMERVAKMLERYQDRLALRLIENGNNIAKTLKRKQKP